MNKSKKPSQITEETINILKEGQYGPKEQKVKLDLKRVRKCKSYSWIPAVFRQESGQDSEVLVLAMDTFEAGIWLTKHKGMKKPVVLDFASDSNPGGGYRTNQEGTQEESLCRRSNLGVCLESAKARYPIPGLGAIYVPDVVVFRNADYSLMDGESVTWLSVIASALRNADSVNNLDQKKRLEDKIRLILSVAVENGHDSIVLGAWGCGAFGGSTETVAKAFNEVIKPYKQYFRYIVFAIPKSRKEQLGVFKNIIQQK